MNKLASTIALFSAATAAVAIDCGKDMCLTPLSLKCMKLSESDCTENCHFRDPVNPSFCSDHQYMLVPGVAVRGRSIQCNTQDQSSRLYYKSLDECADMCDSCVGCVGYVDNREAASPYCVFKDSESTLYKKSSKDFYRGGFFLMRNTAISGSSLKCNAGSTKLAYNTLSQCEETCNSCDGCVGYVDNRGATTPYCVFKSSEDRIYSRPEKDYHRQDTSLLKRISMDALNIAMRDEFDALIAEHPDEDPIRYEDVVEIAYGLLRGDTGFIDFGTEDEPSAVVMRQTSVSDCDKAIAKVVTDSLMLVFTMMGIALYESQMAARAVVSGLPAEAITGFEAAVIDLQQAGSVYDQAAAVVGIAGDVWNLAGSGHILKALKHSMHWYDYIIMSCVLVAQFVATTESGGTALYAEIALAGTAIIKESLDAVAMEEACGMN